MKITKRILLIITILFIPIIVSAKGFNFKDVPKDSWFYTPVKEAYERNIISGYSNTQFAPHDKVTRGQLVTFLWRLEGMPDTSYMYNMFDDVEEERYYTDGVKWAYKNKVVSGYGGTYNFGPNDPIIRQDLAVMLNNYAKYKGLDSITGDSLANFTDHAKVDGKYAEQALKWAVKYNVMSGQNLGEGKRAIAPFINTTRAEAATMIVNFINVMDTMPTAGEVANQDVTQKKLEALETAKEWISYSYYSKQYILDLLQEYDYTYEEALYAVTNCEADWNAEALEAAEDLIDSNYFSYQGLKDYLVSVELFTQAEADYALQNLVVDWNAEALEAAEDYSSSSFFSYEGLKEILVEYEKFTEAQANYALQNLVIDWNAQALNSAKEYLEYAPFSYEGLKEVLMEYEKFTETQATYAANNCGANWNEQAYKKALEYMDGYSYTRAELVSCLVEYELFTEAQANYAANRVGL